MPLYCSSKDLYDALSLLENFEIDCLDEICFRLSRSFTPTNEKGFKRLLNKETIKELLKDAGFTGCPIRIGRGVDSLTGSLYMWVVRDVRPLGFPSLSSRELERDKKLAKESLEKAKEFEKVKARDQIYLAAQKLKKVRERKAAEAARLRRRERSFILRQEKAEKKLDRLDRSQKKWKEQYEEELMERDVILANIGALESDISTKEREREERNLRIQQRRRLNQDLLSKEKRLRKKAESLTGRRGRKSHTSQEVCEKLEERHPGMRDLLAKQTPYVEVAKWYGISTARVGQIRDRLMGCGVLYHGYLKLPPLDPKPHITEEWRKKIENLHPELLLEVELDIKSVEELAFLYEIPTDRIGRIRDRHFRSPTQLSLDLRDDTSSGLVTQLVEYRTFNP